jgi:uncharacterized protein (TIGR00369 family)
MPQINKEIFLKELTTAFTSIPFNLMLGLRLDHLDTHSVSMSFNMKNDLVGNFLQGILHGGVISSVLDMAGGMLVMSSMIEKHPDAGIEELQMLLAKCSTIDLQVSYLNPGRGDIFTAKAVMQKNGSKIAFTRMELHNERGSLIATASGTYRHS